MSFWPDIATWWHLPGRATCSDKNPRKKAKVNIESFGSLYHMALAHLQPSSHLPVPPKNLASSTSASVFAPEGPPDLPSWTVSFSCTQTSSQANTKILLVHIIDQRVDLTLGLDGSRGSNDVTRPGSLHFLTLSSAELVSFSSSLLLHGDSEASDSARLPFLAAYKLREERDLLFFSVPCSYVPTPRPIPPVQGLGTLRVQPMSSPAMCSGK